MPSIQFTSQHATPDALLLMFHGVGASPESLQPLAEYINHAYPDLEIRIPAGFAPSTISPRGFQWFDVIGVTEENRPARVQQVMPAFDQLIRQQAESAGVPLEKVVLLGFSQGTIMSLEWLKQSHDAVAGIIAIAGRFAELPQTAPGCTTPVCLIHGETDQVIDSDYAQQNQQRLSELGIPCELNLLPDTPHSITPTMYPLITDFIQKVI
ncbi:dienelactone hydrolase family protein [Amphritea atlantica]|uniref:Dienelactone hydrolase family protein n=1 Tax=Amphritea atlantica TaxID=355243 RepID=A0ABY5GUR4_9GAMM|nr:dienelactone hydrolase family protein [Amphritea atlantica]